jgi:hypothetical protein
MPHTSIVHEAITGRVYDTAPQLPRRLLSGGWVYQRPKSQPSSAGLWQTASMLLPSGSRTNAP